MEAFQAGRSDAGKVKASVSILYSLRGHRYCDLLLSREEPEDGSALDELAGTLRGSASISAGCVRRCRNGRCRR